CAGALAGGPEAGLAAVAVGQVVEKAINLFGARIVERWCAWFRGQPPEARQAPPADLAALSAQEARAEAAAALDRLAPHAYPATPATSPWPGGSWRPSRASWTGPG